MGTVNAHNAGPALEHVKTDFTQNRHRRWGMVNMDQCTVYRLEWDSKWKENSHCYFKEETVVVNASDSFDVELHNEDSEKAYRKWAMDSFT